MERFERVSVVGAVGCGKTTLSRALADRMQVPHVELDVLRYTPSWAEAPDESFVAQVARAATAERWVIDGNYELVRPLVWQRSQTVVWVDYPLPVVMWRLLLRTAWRLVTREKFGSGNRERLARLFSKRSIILWAVQSHRARQRLYERELLEPRFRHLHVERLRSPAAANGLLSRMSRSQLEGEQ